MWLHRAVWRRLELESAEKANRIVALESALELERHENRMAERHWANSLLRARQAFPMQPEKTALSAPKLSELVPAFDPGERIALIETARSMGITDPEREADRILREEHGGFIS